jgi:hypothetical protein
MAFQSRSAPRSASVQVSAIHAATVAPTTRAAPVGERWLRFQATAVPHIRTTISNTGMTTKAAAAGSV